MTNGPLGWFYILGCVVFVALLAIFDKTGVMGGVTGMILACTLGLAALAAFASVSISAITRRGSDKETERGWEREHAIPVVGGEASTMAGESGRGMMNTIVPMIVAAIPVIFAILLCIWATVVVTPLPTYDAAGNVTGTVGVGKAVFFGLGVGAVIGGVVAMFLSFIRAPFGYDTWTEWGQTIIPRVGATGIMVVVMAVLAIPGGLLLSKADELQRAAQAQADAMKMTEVNVPASATLYTLIGGMLIGAMMLVPFVVVVQVLKGIFKTAAESDTVKMPLDEGSRSQLSAEWMRDSAWVERKQSSSRMAMIRPALITYAVMIVGTLVVYAFLAIFIPDFRHVGWPVEKGGPLWLLLLLPPLVCVPPFLPLFGSLIVGVTMRRKVREGGGLTG